MTTVKTEVRLALVVEGQPVPQGSMTSVIKGRWNEGRTRFIPMLRKRDGMPVVETLPSNKDELKVWRSQVAAEAREAWCGREWLEDVDVFVSVEFRFPRLKSHYGTGRNASVLKRTAAYFKRSYPDIDKLQRAAFDALTEAQVWKDDSLVVDVHARKVYADTPGMALWVSTPTPTNEEEQLCLS